MYRISSDRSSRFWLLPPSAVWLAWLLSLPPRPSAWTVVLAGLPLLMLASWLSHLRSSERWLQFVRRTADDHALAGILLFALGVQFEDTHGITTDGVIYFSHLRSLIFDGDLDIAEEFAFLGQPPRPSHVVPIGPTVVWLPLYLAVALFDVLGRSTGVWSAPSEPIALGLTLPYVRAALVSSFVAGAVGLIILHQHLRHEFGRGVAFAATLLTFAATPLVWYMVYEPSMTHAVSFMFIAVFVVSAARWTSVKITTRQCVMLGALLGAAFISRPQEALFAFFPAVLLLMSDVPLRERLKATVRFAAWGLVGALPFLIAQAAEAAIVLSRQTYLVTGEQGYLNFFHSRIDDTLWSSWHGFLSWSPVAYIALIGIAAYLSRQLQWAVATLLIVFLMAWINGSTADWAAGWAFGGRRFVGCLVILAPGLAYLVQQLARRPMIPITLTTLAVVLWNQLLVTQYASGMVTAGRTVSFGEIIRKQAAAATRPPFFYPFAFPANLWFAWRTGLPVDRYDLLSPEELRPSFDVVLDANATKYLMEGWGPRASDPSGELRWIEGRRAELVVPLAPVDTTPITIVIQARTRQLDPPLKTPVTLFANGNRIGSFTPETQQSSAVSFSVPTASGIWIRGFNRVRFEKESAAPPIAIYRVEVR